jgi:hypothetical protein
MSTLCEIILVSDELEFFNSLKRNGYVTNTENSDSVRFRGEVPAINTTFEIASDENKEGKQRLSGYFRVLYHHRVLKNKIFSTFMSSSEADARRGLKEGDMEVEICLVFVVKLSGS